MRTVGVSERALTGAGVAGCGRRLTMSRMSSFRAARAERELIRSLELNPQGHVVAGLRELRARQVVELGIVGIFGSPAHMDYSAIAASGLPQALTLLILRKAIGTNDPINRLKQMSSFALLPLQISAASFRQHLLYSLKILVVL